MKPDDDAPPSDATTTATAPRVRGLRAGWLGGALLALGSLALPWSCGNSPLTYAASWSGDDPGGRVLALGVALPLVLLALTAMLESRALPQRVRAVALALGGVASLLALSIGAFGDRVTGPMYRDVPGAVVQFARPAPIRFFQGASHTALEFALLAPVAALAAWGLAARREGEPAVALRAIAAQTFVGLALLWAPYCDGAGWWLGVALGGGLFVTAFLVPDESPSPTPRARRALSLAACAWLVVTAALVEPHRLEYVQQLDRALHPPPR